MDPATRVVLAGPVHPAVEWLEPVPRARKWVSRLWGDGYRGDTRGQGKAGRDSIFSLLVQTVTLVNPSWILTRTTRFKLGYWNRTGFMPDPYYVRSIYYLI